MNGLRSDYLDTLSRKFIDDFHGVEPCDFVSLFDPKKSKSIILNLSPSNEKGSHFVAMYIDGQTCIYFDPFGLKCFNQYIIDFVLKIGYSQVIYSAQQIQHFSSLFCGYYCLSFLISQQKNHLLNDFLSIFSNVDLRKNDDICIRYIKNSI